MAKFKPDQDIPDLSSKTVIVTGGSAGLGRETVLSLVRHGNPRIFFTGRNEATAKETVDAVAAINPAVDVSFVKCDLSDLASVKAACSKISDSVRDVDIIFCNAGIMATPGGLSKDGFEIQFATNHLGHAMLVHQLLPKLQKTAANGAEDVRVIFNSSQGHRLASKIDYATIRSKQEAVVLGAFRRYGQSKLANVLYPSELARRHPEITFVSIHPGVIRTDLINTLSTFNRYFTNITTFGRQVSVQEGVKNQLWAATAPKSEVTNGLYYEPIGVSGLESGPAKDASLSSELYEWTVNLLSEYE